MSAYDEILRRLDSAIKSLSEYVDGTWEGTEGITAIENSLHMARMLLIDNKAPIPGEDAYLVFQIGDRVRKPEGYPYPGIVVAAFRTTAGKERYVVECAAPACAGMLHIFNRDQLELAS